MSTYFKQADIQEYSKTNSCISWAVLKNPDAYDSSTSMVKGEDIFFETEPFKNTLSPQEWRNLTATVITHLFL
jgi:hypothetical protein